MHEVIRRLVLQQITNLPLALLYCTVWYIYWRRYKTA